MANKDQVPLLAQQIPQIQLPPGQTAVQEISERRFRSIVPAAASASPFAATVSAAASAPPLPGSPLGQQTGSGTEMMAFTRALHEVLAEAPLPTDRTMMLKAMELKAAEMAAARYQPQLTLTDIALSLIYPHIPIATQHPAASYGKRSRSPSPNPGVRFANPLVTPVATTTPTQPVVDHIRTEASTVALLKALSTEAPYVADEKLLGYLKEKYEVRCQDSYWKQGIVVEDLSVPNTLVKILHTPDGAERLREAKRESWSKKVDFLLSVIGFSVDLSSVWRFPNLVFKNGGGAFFIPYTLMLVFGGLPLFYMELALGQYNRRGAITCWGQICPLFKGIGYTLVLIALFVDLYYNVIIAWCLYYLFSSFALVLPWTNCNNTWNTPNCTSTRTPRPDLTKLSEEEVAIAIERQKYKVPASFEYFYRGVLEVHEANGIDDLGHVKIRVALCIAAIFLICYFALWKGVSSSGKVVWFAAVLPYFVIIGLLIMSLTLPGAFEGIKYYFYPQFDRLLDPLVWQAAASQVFFSLGPGFGVLLAFASYNKFNNQIHIDAIITTVVSYITSVLCGALIFCGLGYIAHETNQEVPDIAVAGEGLIFALFPEAIATMPAPTIVALLFFMMLLLLGLTSSLGGSEAVITAMCDEFPTVIGHNREIFVGCLFTFYFLFNLPCATQGGVYIVYLFDNYAVQYSILVAVFFETLAISWFYGTDQFCRDVEEMIGHKPGLFWRVCWKYVAPIFILTILIMGLSQWEPLEADYGHPYKYPIWANVLGWLLATSSLMCIPVVAIYKLLKCRGTLRERWQQATMPWRVEVLLHLPIKSEFISGDLENTVTIASPKQIQFEIPGGGQTIQLGRMKSEEVAMTPAERKAAKKEKKEKEAAEKKQKKDAEKKQTDDKDKKKEQKK